MNEKWVTIVGGLMVGDREMTIGYNRQREREREGERETKRKKEREGERERFM